MRIIDPRDFVTMPWKNGGGVTHEIARQDDGGRMVWRLSIAEVASDGPFSAFPGMMRVLTVIDGAGMALDIAGRTIEARPLFPVRFAGDAPVIGRLLSGAVRDFNLIFDPLRVSGGVEAVKGPAGRAGRLAAILSLSSGVSADGAALPAGAVALQAGAALLEHGARALVVEIAAV